MNTSIRKTVIGGNWKLNGMPGDCDAFAKALAVSDSVEVFLALPYLLLPEAVRSFADSPVQIAAQTVSQFASGAYTGEISAAQLQACGVSYTLIGHSERRQYGHESDEEIAAKVKAALDSGMTVILCVGEGWGIRGEGQQNRWIARQLKAALSGLDQLPAERFCVAYEPIWAIGSGCAASPADAGAMCTHIRACLTALLGKDKADRLPLLYGGSVSPDNVSDLLACPDVDGALVGGASLRPDSFSAIIRAAEAAR